MCLMGSLRSMLCVASGTKRQTVFQNSFHLATTVITAALVMVVVLIVISIFAILALLLDGRSMRLRRHWSNFTRIAISFRAASSC